MVLWASESGRDAENTDHITSGDTLTTICLSRDNYIVLYIMIGVFLLIVVILFFVPLIITVVC